MNSSLLGKYRYSVIRGLRTILLIAALAVFPAQTVDAAEEDWPQEIIVPEGKIVMYQPQLESFKGDKLTARAAISVTKKGESEPVFGAVWLEARVQTDRNTRIVTLQSVKMTNARFPNADPEKIKKLGGILEREIPKWDLTISLDRLLAMLDLVEKEKAATGDLNTKPPRIIFVTHPAVLVTIDGDPELRKIENSDLMRVVNTPVFMVLDPSNKTYYLQGGTEWFSADDVLGPWKEVANPPATVAAEAAKASGKSQQGPSELQKEASRAPQIIVTTVPAELIVSEGEPKYKTIQDTGLLYMSNTVSDVFLEIDPQRYYILLSGRWFVASSLDGPWEHVDSEKLPGDFTKIPAGSDRGYILASVAGTEEAQEAVLDTYIPQTAAIKRDATVDVTYDGKPKFKEIEGTEMHYAVNTAYSVIRVDKRYYCCHNAVWYAATNPLGPWTVSTSVPKVIYTIPPEYPVYNVKYVYIYDTTPDVVYVGYTPGYVGTYVYGTTVVYGTGYVYHGWYGHVHHYHYPVTYGYAVAYRPYYGWAVPTAFAAGVWAGSRWGGWYGGYGRYGDIDINRTITTPRGTWSGSVDVDWDGGDLDIDRSANFTPNDNLYDRRDEIRADRDQQRGEREGTRGEGKGDREARRGDREAGERSRPERTGDRAATDRRTDRPAAERQRPETRREVKPRRENNVYTDRKGNVYRKTDQGWQQRDRNQWSNTGRSRSDIGTRSSAGRSSFDRSRSDLNRNYQARQRGAQRTNSYRQSRSSRGSRSGFQRSGGGRRGGGRRR
jgi:hypothetical protein